MLEFLKINPTQSTPIYKQIIKSVVHGIRSGTMPAEAKLPSINEVSTHFDIARGTVEKAYNELKENGTIEAVHGKGFFIKTGEISAKTRIFLLFNKLSAHKKIIYDAFTERLGENVKIDFYVYNNHLRVFRDLIQNTDKMYHYYVIIPHFFKGEDEAAKIINKLPAEKLILLDKELPGMRGNYSSIYQNFEKDINNALNEVASTILGRYQRLKILFPPFTYHPKAILRGFQNFCVDHRFSGKIVPDVEKEIIEPGDCYITLMEADLVALVKKIKATDLQVGKDVGIISYNENPLKEVLLDGITVMSTDFKLLGTQAADMILNKSTGHFETPFRIILRNSL